MYCFQVSMYNLKRAGNEWCWGKCHVAADCHIEPRRMHGYWIYAQFAVGHCSDVTEGGLQNFRSSYMALWWMASRLIHSHRGILMYWWGWYNLPYADVTHESRRTLECWIFHYTWSRSLCIPTLRAQDDSLWSRYGLTAESEVNIEGINVNWLWSTYRRTRCNAMVHHQHLERCIHLVPTPCEDLAADKSTRWAGTLLCSGIWHTNCLMLELHLVWCNHPILYFNLTSAYVVRYRRAYVKNCCSRFSPALIWSAVQARPSLISYSLGAYLDVTV